MGAATDSLESSYPLLSENSADVRGPHNPIVLTITNEHKESALRLESYHFCEVASRHVALETYTRLQKLAFVPILALLFQLS